ncbi:hypothetical protein RUND412_001970 [Rhizina undulata]
MPASRCFSPSTTSSAHASGRHNIAIVAFIVSLRFRTALEATVNYERSLEFPLYTPPQPATTHTTTDLIIWDGAIGTESEPDPKIAGGDNFDHIKIVDVAATAEADMEILKKKQ